MPRHGRDQKDLGIVLAACFLEAKQLAERRPHGPALVDRNGRAIDLDAVDGIVGACMSEAGERDQFVISPHPCAWRRGRMRRPGGKDPRGVLRQQTHAIADIGHPLVCVVHHEGARTPPLKVANRMPSRLARPLLIRQQRMRATSMSQTTLTISSRNYSSWSLRGWLMAKLARIDFEEVVVAPDDAGARAEILLLSPSILVPCLTYNEIRVWDTLAIGEFLNEIAPKAGLLPKDQAVRAHCRSVCGEMHSGFVSLRPALPDR